MSHLKKRRQLAGSWTTSYQGWNSLEGGPGGPFVVVVVVPRVSGADSASLYRSMSPDDLLSGGALFFHLSPPFFPPSKRMSSTCFHRGLWVPKGKCATHPSETVAKLYIQECASHSSRKCSRSQPAPPGYFLILVRPFPYHLTASSLQGFKIPTLHRAQDINHTLRCVKESALRDAPLNCTWSLQILVSLWLRMSNQPQFWLISLESLYWIVMWKLSI